ncbi:Anaphase-promoting complex subunit 23 [Entophlyctis luteolus]|nr:Anaphase-promoting complex subunit 23 [Entophlyctis luteolus]KAJ3395188.1 Anaphase-promoting complex subunit 23 [Entophlyctis sp. JEL0112]
MSVAQLQHTALACCLRGLYSTAEWLTGIAPSASAEASDGAPAQLTDHLDPATLRGIALFNASFPFAILQLTDSFLLTPLSSLIGDEKSKQFALAAFVLAKAEATSPIARFVRYYSTLLDAEAKSRKSEKDEILRKLQDVLEGLEARQKDGYILFVHSLVCLRLKMKDRATELLIECVRATPLLQCAWEELIAIVSSYDKMQETLARLDTIPHSNPCLQYFKLQTAMHFSPLSVAQKHLSKLLSIVNENYPGTQLAEASMYYHNQDHPRAIELYSQVYAENPALLDLCDEYANALYVVEDGTQLSWLAHRCNSLDPYRPETCVAVANYYSIRREHEKAIGYLRKAILLDEGSSLAWTLIGHEYLEMKNQVAAIQVYRKAVEKEDINDRDFRAWYALGNLYQMLKMPLYALFYFHKATILKPYDSRFWCGVASCHEDLKNYSDALKSYKRALAVDEAQHRSGSTALIRLARLYSEMDSSMTIATNTDNSATLVPMHAGAAAMYYKQVFETRGLLEEAGNRAEVKEAAEYLVNHALKTKIFTNIDQCLEYLSNFEDTMPLVREFKALMK